MIIRGIEVDADWYDKLKGYVVPLGIESVKGEWVMLFPSSPLLDVLAMKEGIIPIRFIRKEGVVTPERKAAVEVDDKLRAGQRFKEVVQIPTAVNLLKQELEDVEARADKCLRESNDFEERIEEHRAQQFEWLAMREERRKRADALREAIRILEKDCATDGRLK